ncbi:hypothetical protein CsSME_00043640 [Camellia sinensis var. sinensis]
MATPAPPISPPPFPKPITASPRKDTHPLSLLPKCNSLRELKQIQAYCIKTHLQNDISVLPSSSTSAPSTQPLPPWNMPTTCSTKFPTQTFFHSLHPNPQPCA